MVTIHADDRVLVVAQVPGSEPGVTNFMILRQSHREKEFAPGASPDGRLFCDGNEAGLSLCSSHSPCFSLGRKRFYMQGAETKSDREVVSIPAALCATLRDLVLAYGKRYGYGEIRFLGCPAVWASRGLTEEEVADSHLKAREAEKHIAFGGPLAGKLEAGGEFKWVPLPDSAAAGQLEELRRKWFEAYYKTFHKTFRNAGPDDGLPEKTPPISAGNPEDPVYKPLPAHDRAARLADVRERVVLLRRAATFSGSAKTPEERDRWAREASIFAEDLNRPSLFGLRGLGRDTLVLGNLVAGLKTWAACVGWCDCLLMNTSDDDPGVVCRHKDTTDDYERKILKWYEVELEKERK